MPKMAEVKGPLSMVGATKDSGRMVSDVVIIMITIVITTTKFIV